MCFFATQSIFFLLMPILKRENTKHTTKCTSWQNNPNRKMHNNVFVYKIIYIIYKQIIFVFLSPGYDLKADVNINSKLAVIIYDTVTPHLQVCHFVDFAINVDFCLTIYLNFVYHNVVEHKIVFHSRVRKHLKIDKFVLQNTNCRFCLKQNTLALKNLI